MSSAKGLACNAGHENPALRRVREAVDQFADGMEQFDDITMLCFKYKGGSEKADQTS